MKIGLLASRDIDALRLKALSPILDDKSFDIDLVIILEKPQISNKKKVIKHLKRGRGGYVIILFWKKLFGTKKQNDSIKTEQFCNINDLSYFKTKSLYSPETIQKIKEANLDILILCGGLGIIKNTIIELPRNGILSYHHGDMSRYRGMPPAFWELYNNEEYMGVTVQQISAKLDKGKPIIEKSIKISKKDTLKSLHEKAFKQSEDMLYSALLKFKDSSFEPSELHKYGKVYTLPNLSQFLKLKVLLLFRKLFNSKR